MWKQKYKITNWSSYNESLKKRGSLTVWLEEGFEHTWYEDSENKKTKRGRPMVVPFVKTVFLFFRGVIFMLKFLLLQYN